MPMKTIIFILSAVALLFSDPIIEVPYSRIENAFNSNDAAVIVSIGKEKILLKIMDKEGGYNHTQAELILQDFFTKNANGQFSFTFKGQESEDGVFCMGLYVTKSEKYKISFQFKKMKTSYQFESLTIVLEKK